MTAPALDAVRSSIHVLAGRAPAPYAHQAMDASDPHPAWLQNMELICGVLSALCIFAVLMIVVMHLWWRSGCTTFGIC